MALEPLAFLADLPSHVACSEFAQAGIDVATAAIREAAGCPISQITATVRLDGSQSQILRLPGPVVPDSVSSVTIDGIAINAPIGYRQLSDGLWRRVGWTGRMGDPGIVRVEYTFGLPVVPADIRDLVVQLAIAYVNHMSTGGGSTPGITSAALDDAKETYSAEYAGALSPVFIPEVTRTWLKARFGSSAVVIESYGNARHTGPLATFGLVR